MHMSLFLSAGPLPRKESETKVSFALRDSTVETEWSASATHDPSGNTVLVSISSSPNAPIGVYSLTVDQEGLKTALGQFTLLFNAWCPGQYIYLSFAFLIELEFQTINIRCTVPADCVPFFC